MEIQPTEIQTTEGFLGKVFLVLPEFLRRVGKIDAKLCQMKVNPSHMYVMAELAFRRQMSMSEIAKSMNMSKQQATQLVDRMIQLELVERQTDEKDRRKINITISETGKEVSRRLQYEMNRRLEERLAVLNLGERQELEQALDTMNHILQKII